ncbi:MAG: DUF3971 domain-containing protein, partial [Pseudomonadota bacterium]
MSESPAVQDPRRFGFFRSCRRLIWKLLLWFIIASAVIVSLGRLLAPYADRLTPLAEQILSQALNQPVQIGHIEAQWPRFSPQILLHDLTVGTTEDVMLQVDRARLEIRLYNLVRPALNSFELIALGLNLALVEDAEGRWSWQIQGGGQVAGGWQRGLSAGDLKLRSSTIRIAPFEAPPLIWYVPEADLNRRGDELRIRFSAFERFDFEAALVEPSSAAAIEEWARFNDSSSSDAQSPLDVRIVLNLSNEEVNSLHAYLQNDRSRLPIILTRWFARVAEQSFDPAAVPPLQAATKIWLNWADPEPFKLHAELAFSGLPEDTASQFKLNGYWQPDDWALEMDANNGVESIIQGLALARRDGYTGFAVERFKLDALHRTLSHWLDGYDFWPATVSGELRHVQAGWLTDTTPFALAGQVESLDVVFDAPQFALRALDVELGLSGDRYAFGLSGRPQLDWKFLYDEPVDFDFFDGQLELSRDGLHVEQLRVATRAFEFTAAGDVLRSEENVAFAGPFIDLTIDLPRLESDNLRRWLPQRGIPRKTRSWLNQALIALESGRALTTLHGWPLGWKQYTPPGAVHSVIDFTGLDLQYGRNWPMAQNMRGRLEFESERMVGRVDSGEVVSTPLSAPAVIIPQMREAEIEIQLASEKTSAGQLLNLVKALPLQQAQTALATMDWRGEASAVAEVFLPVRRRHEWELNGRLELNDVDFELIETGFAVDQIQAEVPFDRAGFGPAELSGRIAGESADFSLETRFEPEFNLTVASELPLAALLLPDWRERWPDLIDTLEAQTQGRSLWQLDLGRVELPSDIMVEASVGAGNGGTAEQAERPLELHLRSTLVGTELDLPAPLTKPAQAEWPFLLELELGELGQPFMFRVGDVVDGQVLLDPDFWQFGLTFGGERARLPSAERFYITGQIERLETSPWLELLGATMGRSDLFSPPEMNEAISGWLSLEVDEWSLGDAELGSMELALAREDDFWRLHFAGSAMAGSVRLPADSASMPLAVARFEYLHWPLSEPDQPSPEPWKVDPRRLPELQLAIDDLRWGELDLGQVRLTSHAQDNGLEIEQFSIARAGLELAGSGRWIVNDQTQFPFQTEARMRLTDDDLGTSLNQAGFELALERGRAVIELDGRWPGSPLDFSLAREIVLPAAEV